jgi:hypothetical protein
VEQHVVVGGLDPGNLVGGEKNDAALDAEAEATGLFRRGGIGGEQRFEAGGECTGAAGLDLLASAGEGGQKPFAVEGFK